MTSNISEDDAMLLNDILSHCNTIGNAVKKTGCMEDFVGNIHLAQSCAYSLIRIGELTNRLSLEVRRTYMFVPWTKFREYETTAIKTEPEDMLWQKIWDICNTDVPRLKKGCEKILDEH